MPPRFVPGSVITWGSEQCGEDGVPVGWCRDVESDAAVVDGDGEVEESAAVLFGGGEVGEFGDLDARRELESPPPAKIR